MNIASTAWCLLKWAPKNFFGLSYLYQHLILW